MVVSDEFLDKMFMKNQLYKSSNQISEDLSLEDIIKILGIILYMRIFKLPKSYSSKYYGWLHAVNKMKFTCNSIKFNKILNLLHFNNNNLISDGGTPEYGRCYKIKPIID